MRYASVIGLTTEERYPYTSTTLNRSPKLAVCELQPKVGDVKLDWNTPNNDGSFTVARNSSTELMKVDSR